MSVLVSNRKESQYEAITHSTNLHNELIDLMQRNFGVKDINHFVRVKYAYGDDSEENFAKYRYLIHNSKTQIDKTATLLTNNLVAAKSLYPTSLSEYEQRRSYQNAAIANCEQLLMELQRTVEIFDVNLNVYSKCVKDINREIELIKRWRQKDNKFKSYLTG